MRCKKCAKTFRTPPQKMRETQICAECSKTNFPTRDEVKKGSSVLIEKKRDQGTGILTQGIVHDVLTPGNYHPDGLMVDLENGERGRVKKLLSKEIIKNNNDFSSDNNTDKIVTKGSAKWTEDVTSDINYEETNEAIPNIIENEKEKNNLHYLREEQIKNHNKLIQINNEIESLKIKEEAIQGEIKLEEKNLENYKEKGFSRFIRKYSMKNRALVEWSEKFLSVKYLELEKIYSELNIKKDKQNIYRIKETESSEIIKQLEKKEYKEDEEPSSVKSSWTSKKYEEWQKLADAVAKNPMNSLENNSPSTEKFTPIYEDPIDKLLDAVEVEMEAEKLLQKETISMNDVKVQNRSCKEICKKFKAKKPIDGGRYEAGQAHCQICDVWIDYRGAHTREGLPATEDSVGWSCNCCNYRIRQKPRNKIYKEKLAAGIAAKKAEFELINQNPCPKCGIESTVDNITSIFGMRLSNGKSIRQSFCRKCRTSNSLQTREPKVLEQTIKLSIDKINRLISDSLVLIRKNTVGIYEESLVAELKITKSEFKEILPKLLRLEDIVEEEKDWDNGVTKKILKSIKVKEENSTDEDKLRNEIKELEKQALDRYEERLSQKEQIKNPTSSKIKYGSNIEIECMEVIKYKQNRRDWKFASKVIDEYLRLGSVRKVCEKIPWEKEERIRRHMQTSKRVPQKLQEKAHWLLSDPESSLAIALYATDFFNWDGESENEEKILNFATDIAKTFENNPKLRFMLFKK